MEIITAIFILILGAILVVILAACKLSGNISRCEECVFAEKCADNPEFRCNGGKPHD